MIRVILSAVLTSLGFAAPAATFDDQHRNEIFWGIDRCAVFHATRDLTLFSGLRAKPYDPFGPAEEEGKWFLPSGDLFISARRVGPLAPSCKIIAFDRDGDDFKANAFDRQMYGVLDDIERVRIGDVTYTLQTGFKTSSDTNFRLVGCVGGQLMALETAATIGTGAAQVGHSYSWESKPC